MPETQTVDEVVAERTSRAPAARPAATETVSETGAAKTVRAGVEEEAVPEGRRRGRAFKESTEKLLADMEKSDAAATLAAGRAPAPHEVGDADEDEPDEADAGAAADDDSGEAGADDVAAAAEGVAAEESAGEEPADDAPSEVDTIKATAARLEARNRELISELDAARKTPKAERTEREQTLLDAEDTYVNEGSVAALRKFLAVVVGAKPDSKEVSAELAGLYLDLTSQEIGVPLDQNQQALRDNARTRMLLAREKREKADAGKKADPGNGADEAVQYEHAAKYVDGLLTTKGTNGASIADEYPLLMSLSRDFDGYAPSEVIARAVRQEYMAGTIDPNGSETDAIRTVAQKIEKHYDGVAKRIEAARAKKNPTPDTTQPSGKTPKAASQESKEQRQSTGARTITNAAASRAPATPPKTTKQKASNAEKSRKDFPNEAAYREYLLAKHFPA